MFVKRGYLIIVLLILLIPFISATRTDYQGGWGYFIYYDRSGGSECHRIALPGVYNQEGILAPFPCVLACYKYEGQTYLYYYVDSGATSPWAAGVYVNWDGDSRSCGCYGKTWIAEPAKFQSGLLPYCCGDDASENAIARVCDSDTCQSNTGDKACCTVSTSCVYDGACIPTGTCKNNFYCGSGIFYDPDDAASYCQTCIGEGRWELPEYQENKPNCCGDDDKEYKITKGAGIDTGFFPNGACCNSSEENICVDKIGRCRTEHPTEITCDDGIDNDCDGQADCSDIADCSGTNYCIGCSQEECSSELDEDCDQFVDCADYDCLANPSCPGCIPESTTKFCNNFYLNGTAIDDDCDNKPNCQDPDCNGIIPCEKIVDEVGDVLCNNGVDDDKDGFIDHSDWDCECPYGTTLCEDNTCSDECEVDDTAAKGCINPNGICEEGEGCVCEDCESEEGPCSKKAICLPYFNICGCPSGTRQCPDGYCKKGCGECGDGKIDPGEECDKKGPVLSTELDNCNDVDTCGEGAVTCTEDCIVNTASCSCPSKCDPAKKDGDCCAVEGDDKCDSECTAGADSDCAGKCTVSLGDCCDDKKGNGCDLDCISYKDPDCTALCDKTKDDCCNAASGDGCDPDCDEGVDPDCPTCTTSQGDCCNDKPNNGCDKDCIPGVDPDCGYCGNQIAEKGETCDGIDLSNKNCASFGFESGELYCYQPGNEKECHFDTGFCYKPGINCKEDGACDVVGGEDCTCKDCLDKQATCNYGAVCDETARCGCEEAKTLCKDGTCRIPAECEALPGCKGGSANGNCEPEEGCDCSDCEGKTSSCKNTAACSGGVCTSCAVLKAYWTEDCVGCSVKDKVAMVVEGTSGCKGKTVTLDIWKDNLISDEDIPNEDEPSPNQAIFNEQGKAEMAWSPVIEEEGTYYFIAKVGTQIFKSTNLETKDCNPDCDADCDGICDPDKTEDESCKDDCKGSDENSDTPWCEDVGDEGLSSGQETCAAFYDCTPGWWKETTPTGWTGQTKIDATSALEWTECDEDMMRTRQICSNPSNCCTDQGNCYCKMPTNLPQGLDCGAAIDNILKEKACLVAEKFPFFTNMNILIVVLILTGFYIWKIRRD